MYNIYIYNIYIYIIIQESSDMPYPLVIDCGYGSSSFLKGKSTKDPPIKSEIPIRIPLNPINKSIPIHSH